MYSYFGGMYFWMALVPKYVLMHNKVQKWKYFLIKVLWPSIHKNMIQILNYNSFFQNSAFNLTCWCYFTNLVALGRKTVNTRVEHILFLLPAIVGMAKMAWWDSHVLQLCLSVFCHQVKNSNTILESKLVCRAVARFENPGGGL